MKKNEIIINELRIVYFTEGEGKPLLFLHGGRIRALTYKRNLELLSKIYKVIAPDIPGYGESDTPKEIWNYKNYNAFFNTFMEKLKLKNVIVIGHSMGGSLAFHLASDSKLVSELVLVNANGVDFSGKNAISVEIERILFYITSPQYWKTFFVLMQDAVFHYTRHFFDLHKQNKIRRNYVGSKEVLKKINIPTLILWSTNDSIFPLSVAGTFNKWIKVSTLEVVDGTHDWLFYKPKLFYDKIVSFKR